MVSFDHRVHAVCVCDDAEAFYKHTSEELVAYGLTVGEQGSPLNSRDILDLIEGYKGEGYGKTTSSDLSKHNVYCRIGWHGLEVLTYRNYYVRCTPFMQCLYAL